MLIPSARVINPPAPSFDLWAVLLIIDKQSKSKYMYEQPQCYAMTITTTTKHNA